MDFYRVLHCTEYRSILMRLFLYPFALPPVFAVPHNLEEEARDLFLPPPFSEREMAYIRLLISVSNVQKEALNLLEAASSKAPSLQMADAREHEESNNISVPTIIFTGRWKEGRCNPLCG